MLMDLSVNAANRVVIANAGGIHPLIAMAQDGNDKMKLKAVGTLSNLSVNAVNKVKMADAGAILLLVGLLRHGNRDLRVKATVALASQSIDAVDCSCGWYLSINYTRACR
ncbi:Armadillo/beta-catenin-like repeat [Phytophthora infestans]|uniref:Armadillo/beta-catenin-like repeat n=1 Tax=Phytophthora infestans TaxID=4787 RepID=A0A833VXW3_PHYIN|nr:Armadillo/beta-catenin-like repeat [Phytophthora infestans]